jgi:hypothetical protein
MGILTVSQALNNEDRNSVFDFKNRIINGAMVIDQRNGGSSVTPASGTDTFPVDRFSIYSTQANKTTAQQNQGNVTRPVRFTNYLGVTSSSAYSVVSTDLFGVFQNIEGYNTADLDWGTVNAKTVTLSFWVRSSLTGTFGGAILNSAQTRSYPFSYTINNANTWEYETITIPGDTTGDWLTTTGRGMTICWSLGVGTNFIGTVNTWAADNNFAPTGATSIVGTNGATFYITGVQLEAGKQETAFEYRPYGAEVALCQRYCTKFGGVSTNDAFGSGFSAGTSSYYFVPFPVQMRTTPTITLYGTASDISVTTVSVAAVCNGIPSVIGTGVTSTVLQAGHGTSITSGYAVYIRSTSSSTFITFTAEL